MQTDSVCPAADGLNNPPGEKAYNISITDFENIREVTIKMTNELTAQKIISENGVAAALEARRLAEKYNKDFFNCDDLVYILNVGKNNVRQLMRSNSFPTIEIGNRKIVSAIALAFWMLQNRMITA